jgi:hypothetical protein
MTRPRPVLFATLLLFVRAPLARAEMYDGRPLGHEIGDDLEAAGSALAQRPGDSQMKPLQRPAEYVRTQGRWRIDRRL